MFFRGFLLSSLALAAHLGWAQGTGLDPKITLEIKAAPASKVLAEISRQAGIGLAPSGKIENEILSVRVTDVKLSDLMAKLAEVAGAEWQPAGNGYLFVYDDAKLKALDRKHALEIAKGIEKSLKAQVGKQDLNKVWSAAETDKVMKEFQSLSERMQQNGDEMPPDPTLYEKYAQYSSMNPTSRLAYRLVGLLDPLQIAKMPSNARIVFSTNPTRMQRPIQGGARAVNAFQLEQSAWAASASQMPKPDMDGEGFDSYFDMGMGVNSNAMKGRIAKVLLCVTRYGSMAGFNIEVKVANDKGQVVASSTVGIHDEDLGGIWGEEMDPTKPKPEDKSPDVRLSPVSKAITLAMNAMRGEMGGENLGLKGLKPEFKAMLFDPEQFDPLSFVAADGLHSIAETEKLNLVASIPDRALMPSWYITSAGRATEKKFMSLLKAMGEVEVNLSQPGWMTVAPNDGWGSRLTRTNRSALGPLLRNLDQNGYSLDAFASFLAKSPDEGFESVGMMMMYSLFPEVMMTGEMYDLATVRFYGALMADQKFNMAKGRAIAISQLMPSQKAMLHKMIFERADGGMLGQSISSEAIEVPEMATKAEDIAMYGDIFSEATEALPNGLPPNGLMTMEVQREAIAVPVPEKGSFNYGQAYTAEDLGNQLATEERPDLFPWINESPKISKNKFRIGERTRYTFSFKLTERLTDTRTVTDTRTGKGEPAVVTALPDAFRKAMEIARDKARESHKNMKPGEYEEVIPPGNGSPPPK